MEVSVQELHNSMVSPPEEGGMKEARDEDNNIIISDLILHHIIPPQLKKYDLYIQIYVWVWV